MVTETQLKEVLDRLPVERPIVRVERDGLNLIASVTTSTFATLDEAERQEIVWGYLLGELGDAGVDRIEFVFTNAPGEAEAAE